MIYGYSAPVDAPMFSVLTPVALSKATTGPGRKFRKMVLPARKIYANNQDLDLASMFADIERAERERAFDGVALQVADSHTTDPRYTEGTVSNFRHEPSGPDGDGLYADIEFADDKTADVIRKFPAVGVSCSLVKNLRRKENGTWHVWPAAVQHVLMTTDPHVRNMGEWRKVDLMRGIDMPESIDDVPAVFDLSSTTYEEREPGMPTPVKNPFAPADGTKPPEGAPDGTKPAEVTLTADEYAVFKAMAENHVKAATETPPVKSGDPKDAGTPKDSAVVGGGNADPAGGAGPVTADPAGSAPTGLQRDEGVTTEAFNLMREEMEIERQQRIDMQREMFAAKVQGEIEGWEHNGLAPTIVALARTVLEADPSATVINLGRDAAGANLTLDCADVMRKLIAEVVSLARDGLTVLDLDRENGHHVGSDAEQAQRKAKLDAWDAQFPSN